LGERKNGPFHPEIHAAEWPIQNRDATMVAVFVEAALHFGRTSGPHLIPREFFADNSKFNKNKKRLTEGQLIHYKSQAHFRCAGKLASV
jgi:hypothetical protein